MTLSPTPRQLSQRICISQLENPELHKYKVGQTVRYHSDSMRRLGVNSSFKIVRLMPTDGAELQYRLKSASEAHERIARENEIHQDF